VREIKFKAAGSNGLLSYDVEARCNEVRRPISGNSWNLTATLTMRAITAALLQ